MRKKIDRSRDGDSTSNWRRSAASCRCPRQAARLVLACGSWNSLRGLIVQQKSVRVNLGSGKQEMEDGQLRYSRWEDQLGTGKL